MKSFFLLKRTLAVIIALTITVAVESCKKKCKDDATSELIGSWNISEKCGSNNYNYVMTVTTGGESDLLFTNLGQGGPNAVVKVDVCGNDFTIPSQTVQGISFSGDGSVNSAGSMITFSWSGHKGSCSATGTK